MATYSFNEKCEMIIMYGECFRSAIAASRLFHDRFPDRPKPSHKLILRLIKKLGQYGSLHPKHKIGRPKKSEDIDVLAYVMNNPQTSTRAVSVQSGYSRSTVQRALTRNKFHPFHLSVHQTLYQGDEVRRFEMCNWFLNKIHENPNFLSQIIWTDESNFNQDGIVNIHNQHYWAEENPHANILRHNQRRWSFNVWCGIHDNRVIGPLFYEGKLNSQRYLNTILKEAVVEYLDECIPLNILNFIWYQQDGAPAHSSNSVRIWLDSVFPNHWIGKGSEFEWAPRSPDLTPMDFFLWGYIKEKVYVTSPTSPQDLKQRIRDTIEQITPEVLDNVKLEILKRFQACIVSDGGHFE